MKIEFSRQIFEKCPNNKVIKTFSLGADLYHEGGRADRQTYEDEDKSPFSLFCEHA
jgi:hypothetical protein